MVAVTQSDSEVVCREDSGYLINGELVYKTVTFAKNRTWKLHVGKKEIDLHRIYISNKFQLTKDSIRNVRAIVGLIKLCEGVKVTPSLTVTRFHIVERLRTNSSNEKQTVRTILCERALALISTSTTCLKCQRMTLKSNKTENKENQPLKSVNNLDNTKSNNKVSEEDIRKFMPEANNEMVQLLLDQAINLKRDPRGRRWSQKVISVCLQWYCRIPQSYEAFRASKLLILPSPSTLVLYKNRIQHHIGFDQQLLDWMHLEAKAKQIPTDSWVGGLILDEMCIQADIQISKSGDVIELTGLVDLGEEGNACHVLRTKKNEKSIGTHVLQFVFLGVTGFRFPFAHFVTDGIQANELCPLFWEAVPKLAKVGFKTVYTCMDGAQCNRSFMNWHLENKPLSFRAFCPYYEEDIVYMMDVSHVIKKVRNNLLKSGVGSNCTRLLTLPSLKTVQWKMFVNCFRWDKSNSFQLHRKLTNEHFFLSTQSKMRNHLAEDVLGSEMLHTMVQYRNSLGQKGEELNGAVELLGKTAKLIDIFRDMRPIVQKDDQRLNDLQEINAWFTKWEKSVNRTFPQKERGKMLMSYQCHEDLHSCLVGFLELCSIVLKLSRQITPALVNSVVVENIFNQQRSTYNGANSNPNALQYRRTLNSIILGQNTVSMKANAGKGRDATLPYEFSVKTALTSNKQSKKRKLTDI